MGTNFACSHCDYKATQKENLKVLVGTFMNYFVTHEDNLIIKQLKPYSDNHQKTIIKTIIQRNISKIRQVYK